MVAAKGGSVSLRYLAARLRASMEEVAALAGDSGLSNLPAAIEKGLEAYNRPMTSLMYMAGAAMTPTLNPRADSDPSATERLLVRWLPRASARNVFAGDIVAISSPVSQGEVLVRRVAATEGEEMASDEPDEEAWRLPPGTCWVLADNAKLGHTDVIDSRSFGPLAFSSVLGRILYYGRSPSDHGPVENSEAAMAADAPVLEAELEVHKDELCGQ